MRRFLLFGGIRNPAGNEMPEGEPLLARGGWDDFISDFDSAESAVEAGEKRGLWWMVRDTADEDPRRVVRRSE